MGNIFECKSETHADIPLCLSSWMSRAWSVCVRRGFTSSEAPPCAISTLFSPHPGKNRMWVPYSPCETVTPFLMLSRILLPSAVVTRACPASSRCALSIHGVLFSQRTSAEWSEGTWRGPLFPSSMYDRLHVHSAEWLEGTPLSRCPCAFASAFLSADGMEKETTMACPKSMQKCSCNTCK